MPSLKPGRKQILQRLGAWLDITAPITFSTDATGNTTYVSNGRSILGDPTTGLVLAVGNFSWTFDMNGNLVHSLNGTGRLIPVCPMIQ